MIAYYLKLSSLVVLSEDTFGQSIRSLMPGVCCLQSRTVHSEKTQMAPFWRSFAWAGIDPTLRKDNRQELVPDYMRILTSLCCYQFHAVYPMFFCLYEVVFRYWARWWLNRTVYFRWTMTFVNEMWTLNIILWVLLTRIEFTYARTDWKSRLLDQTDFGCSYNPTKIFWIIWFI